MSPTPIMETVSAVFSSGASCPSTSPVFETGAGFEPSIGSTGIPFRQDAPRA
ncbi:hypothetical protein NMB1186 [Neisseria meningitidis MC58]|uniref:Uncharacterized protein n=1 Tax=Neisseria meningitidis serogroup B (strain ATCC BAA-335 / MC58) TaxID=122586 RepID=Q9JRU2_NEIMB|nr:hypothetical protein NMB1148 [Neisseria meningitidis MC58]AAF41570.1 hypothetical protein NMB1186 [Neisseria meningitidis MC58]